MFYVYVLKSKVDGNLYTGHTHDLKRRISEHQSGKVTSTKLRKPFILIYYEACNVLADAVKREHALKTGYGRRYLKNRLSDG